MPKILLVLGSDRDNSFNGQVLNIIENELKNKGIETERLDYSKIPLLSQNTEYPENSEYEKIRETVKNSDGLFFMVPEYNGSYPAAVKNLIDCLSRPRVAGDYNTPTVINGKPVSVGSIAGSTAGKFVRANMNTLTTYVRMNTMPGEGLGLTVNPEAWSTGKVELSEEQLKTINEFLNEFIKFVG